ncbi:hypothetical protein VTH06DRAFT_4682 [Thermothelomyces fergusii]
MSSSVLQVQLSRYINIVRGSLPLHILPPALVCWLENYPPSSVGSVPDYSHPIKSCQVHPKCPLAPESQPTAVKECKAPCILFPIPSGSQTPLAHEPHVNLNTIMILPTISQEQSQIEP